MNNIQKLARLTKSVSFSVKYALFVQPTMTNKISFKFSNKNDDESHNDFKPQSKVQVTNENVHQLIDQWVKENKVCLFMKGVPQMPQCGFSNFAVEVLKFYKVENYKAVNILSDPILREQVKNYSNWPTYPQLFVNGNLIGGADILSDMHKEGTLKQLFEDAK